MATPPHLLLLEDQPDIAALLTLALEDEGRFYVTPARTLQQGQDLLAGRTHFDVVVSDLNLPDSEGLATLKAIRALRSEVPVVAHTGRDSTSESLEAVRELADDYLVKGEVGTAAVVRAALCALEKAQHRQTRDSLAENLQHALGSVRDGMVVLDAEDHRVLFMNNAARGLVGDEIPFAPPIDDVVELTLPNGDIVEVQANTTTWEQHDAIVITIRDVTARRAAQERELELKALLQRANARLSQQVSEDPLTRLLNRRGTNQGLRREQERARRQGTAVSAILLDCDRFKQINDRFSYRMGDTVLCAVAELLQGLLRPVDVVGRVGGDEFLAALPDTKPGEALLVAERIRAAIAEDDRFELMEGVRATVSMGIISIPSTVDTVEALLPLAQRALAISKQAGRDQAAMLAGGTVDVTTMPLTAVHQPVMHLTSNQPTAVEIRVRGVGDLKNPADLFRVARETGTLTALDLRALGVCAQASDGQLPTHLNLFPSTLLAVPPQDIQAQVPDAVLEGGTVLEISEADLLGDPAALQRPIALLRERGFAVALDDLGFGRGGVEALIVLEPDLVKIDPRWVSQGLATTTQRRQLKRLIQVAEIVGSTVVAEGIEDQRLRQLCLELGIELGQGYLWGMPSAVAQLR